MRTAFMREVTKLAAENPRINFITGDLGFSVVEEFAAHFPDQFLNVGVAEQNMAGVAAGMAECGNVVFMYSIGNFPTFRCLEQIRNDICYHSADVKIVSVGGGLGYGALGYSHHAIEDIAVMRALPNMRVIAPGSPWEAAEAVRAAALSSGPCYLRLGRSTTEAPVVRQVDFSIGTAITVRDGYDLTLVSTGAILSTVLSVAGQLESNGVSTRVLSMHTVKPIDEQALLCAVRETAGIVSVEEHSLIGGLGSAIAEVLVDRNETRIPLKRIGLDSKCTYEVGSPEYLHSIYGLTVHGILDVIEEFVRETVGRNLARRSLAGGTSQ